jgi:hypothetical protein
MYLQIEDPSEVPVPPEEVRIKAVELQPYRDGRRVRLMLELTPFQTPPDIAVIVEDGRDQEVSSLSVIAANEATMTLTVHLRDPDAEWPLKFNFVVSYEEQGEVDRRVELLSLEGGENGG